MTTSPSPDIEMRAIPLGNYIYWQPRCLRCRWQSDALFHLRADAHKDAGVHLHNGCLSQVPPDDSELGPA